MKITSKIAIGSIITIVGFLLYLLATIGILSGNKLVYAGLGAIGLVFSVGEMLRVPTVINSLIGIAIAAVITIIMILR